MAKRNAQGWFDVDRDGLAKLCERRGRGFVVHEVLANALDTGAKHIHVLIRALPGGRTAEFMVTDDDPDGFADLTEAYTLFAESRRKGFAEKRGRFGLGEKLVLALCREATISSTKGAVRFDRDGRHAIRDRRQSGSAFSAIVTAGPSEVDDMIRAARAVLIPEDVAVSLSTSQGDAGEALPYRWPMRVVEATLQTEIADDKGVLRRSERKAKIEIHEPAPGEKAAIYEMGVPVVETGDRWSANVLQKVPLTVERDNVLPSYLRDIRAVVLNAMAAHLTPDDASESWVAAAIEDEVILPEAVKLALTARFGEKRVVSDPSDREAEYRAKGAGYTVIPPGAFSKAAWQNVRAAQGALPAGRLFPTQRDGAADSEHGPRSTIPEADWTDGMRAVQCHVVALGERILGKKVAVAISNDGQWNVLATWSKAFALLTFNAAQLGKKWFDCRNRRAINELILHEFAHDAAGGENHLADAYHDAAFHLGAELAEIYATDRHFPQILAGGGVDEAKQTQPEAR